MRTYDKKRHNHLDFRSPTRNSGRGLLLVVFLFLSLGVAASSSAQTPACSNTPGTGERIQCVEDAGSGDDIRINTTAVEIESTEQVPGIAAYHAGHGDIYIDIQGGRVITHFEKGAHGVHATTEDGSISIKLKDVDVEARGATQASTGEYEYSRGVFAMRKGGHGDIDIEVQGGSVLTRYDDSMGIEARGFGGVGDVAVKVRNAGVTTTGAQAVGVFGVKAPQARGNILLDIRDSTIETSGRRAFGVEARDRSNAPDTANVEIRLTNTPVTVRGEIVDAVFANQENPTAQGDVKIAIGGGKITTQHPASHGVHGFHAGIGAVDIDLTSGAAIATNATAEYTGLPGYTAAHAVFARHHGTGDIDVDAGNGSITTKGLYSHAIYGRHNGDGDVYIDTLSGHTITTTGDNGHGVVAYHDGESDTRSIAITVGGSVRTSGSGAQGVRVGSVSNGAPTRIAAPDAEGYPKQTVMVNGSVTGGTGENAAGVFLAGGGRVFIGPRGSVGAASGIAILASGGAPKLRVDMNLAGRRAREAISNGWIINDGGETTIFVNRVKLHDGATGVVPGASAPNGAWNVTIRKDGLTVTDRSENPWKFSGRSESIILDRDFSFSDFTIAEEYAPRTAVYEALPGFLLRLDARGLSEERLAWPDLPVWVKFSGGRGSYEPERASVGAEYDYDRFEAEAGLDLSLGERFAGSVSARHVRGSTEVDSPIGGGEINARGLGFALAASWRGEGGWYAEGRFSLTDYDVDLSSGALGRLAAGVGARGHILDLEAGYRIESDGKVSFAPRVWMNRSGVEVDNFTDAVNSRVSVEDAARLAGGLGVVAETTRALDEGGNFSLRGSLDVEQTLGGAETAVSVSGERLVSESAKTRVLLGLGMDYRSGRFAVGAEVSAGGLGSGDAQYAGQVTFGMKF